MMLQVAIITISVTIRIEIKLHIRRRILYNYWAYNNILFGRSVDLYF